MKLEHLECCIRFGVKCPKANLSSFCSFYEENCSFYEEEGTQTLIDLIDRAPDKSPRGKWEEVSNLGVSSSYEILGGVRSLHKTLGVNSLYKTFVAVVFSTIN